MIVDTTIHIKNRKFEKKRGITSEVAVFADFYGQTSLSLSLSSLLCVCVCV